MDADRTTRRAPGRSALWLVLLLFGLLALAVGRSAPPRPLGTDAAPERFSAARAQALLARLLGDGAPHPVGSAANAAVRERLLEELVALGLAPEVATAWACSSEGLCAEVANVLARLPTSGRGQALLLVTHYDSVGAGPGAADAGAAVAALVETARALVAGPPLPRPVWLLFTDGEEADLLGAEAFVASGAAAEVGFVLNFEARGTAGPSLMFETADEHRGAIALLAEAGARPATSSVYFEIYRRLPNDTDFSVFKRHGLAGLNFAFIGEPLRYHTPRDEVAFLHPGSLQHHGEQALALARAIAARGVEATGGGRAVYFDFLGLFLVHWPVAWTLPLAGLALLLLAVGLTLRRERWSFGGLLAGLCGVLLLPLAGGAIGWLWTRGLVAAGLIPYRWIAEPGPFLLALVALGFAAALLVAAGLARLASPWALAGGAALGWALVAVGLALTLPGASYLALVPALLAGILLVLARRASEAPALLPGWLPAATAALLAFPLAWGLPEALGMTALPAVAAVAALVASAALADCGGRGARRTALLLLALAVGASAWGALQPSFTRERPEPCSLRYLETASGGRWLAEPGSGRLPGRLATAAAFAAAPEKVYPWSRGAGVFAAPGPALKLAPPQLTRLAQSVEESGRRLRLLLRSPRRAPRALVYLPPEAEVRAVTVAGVALPPPTARSAGRGGGEGRFLVVFTLPPDGVEIELLLGGTSAVRFEVVDFSAGLPPGGEALVAARGERAQPIGLGDATVAWRSVEL